MGSVAESSHSKYFLRRSAFIKRQPLPINPQPYMRPVNVIEMDDLNNALWLPYVKSTIILAQYTVEQCRLLLVLNALAGRAAGVVPSTEGYTSKAALLHEAYALLNTVHATGSTWETGDLERLLNA